MDDKAFQKLLDKTAKIAIQHRELMELVGNECVERFGCHYSDIDADNIIDSINYGLGYITVNQVNQDFEDSLRNRNDSSYDS